MHALTGRVDGSSDDQPAAFCRPREPPSADLNPENVDLLCVQSCGLLRFPVQGAQQPEPHATRIDTERGARRRRWRPPEDAQDPRLQAALRHRLAASQR